MTEPDPPSELLELLSDGICVSDAGSRVLYLNPAAERLLGLSRAEAAGLLACDLICGRLAVPGRAECASDCPLRVPEDPARAVSFRGVRDPRESFRWREEGVRRESGGRPLRVRCARVPPPPGEPSRGERRFTILEDASAELALEREREDWRSMIAHDLRAPLTNILGVLRDLEDEPRKPPDPEMVAIALRSGEKMNAMLDLYLEVAKLEAGRMPVDARPLALAPFAASCAAEQAPLAKKKSIEVAVAVPDGLAVEADERLLARALQNLLNNALKFAPEDGRVELRAAADGAGRVRLSVRDTGPGIAPDELPRLFERFRRCRGDERRPGTGLGLAFCREAAAAMGGSIEVESKLGAGTAFTLVLPRARDAA